MLSLQQLRTFLEVADCGSVRDSAANLAVSQPAVSAALASLQRDVGARLVERDGRGLRLTSAGLLLAQYGRRIFSLIEESRERTREVALAANRRLRLAAVTTAAEHLVPGLLRRFREVEPAIDVALEVGNHERVWERLARWEVDLVLAGRPPEGAPFRTVATRAHELVVVAPPHIAITDGTLARGTWLLREPGSGSRNSTEQLFARLAIDPARLTIGSNGAILASVSGGLGFALVSADAIERELASGLLQVAPTEVTPLARHWHVVAAADRQVIPAAERFLEFILDPPLFVAHKSGVSNRHETFI